MEQLDETKLNPPLEWDSEGEYYLDANFIDDDNYEKANGYTISVSSSGRFYLNFPESSERVLDWSTDTLEEAHKLLVEAAIEDGALPR
jgi:hypothetical protein